MLLPWPGPSQVIAMYPCAPHSLYLFTVTKQAWKVLNWNIRGINSPDKWLHIQNKIDESGCSMVCFQEINKEIIDISFIRKFCLARFDCFAYLPSGGLLTVWASSQFSGEVLFQNEYALSVAFNRPDVAHVGP